MTGRCIPASRRACPGGVNPPARQVVDDVPGFITHEPTRMSKPYHVCGLGNALVDILLELDDAAFAALGFERGTMRLVDHAEQRALLERFHGREPRLVSGGSVANSVIACSQLGGQAAFIGC